MDLKDIDYLTEAGFRVEMGSRLQKLEARLSDLELKRDQHYKLHLGMSDRLRRLKAGLTGLEARVGSTERKLKDITPYEPPLSGCRETAWVVKTVHGHGPCGLARSPGAFVWEASFTGNGADEILRFTARSDAETLARLLGIGEPALVYTDTMEEVGR